MYETGDHLVDLWELARDDTFEDEYKRFMELEKAATMRPFSAGLQDLLGGSLTLPWLPNGISYTYEEGTCSGELVEDPADVERLRLSYDLLRDSALSPRDSVTVTSTILEACAPCESPDRT